MSDQAKKQRRGFAAMSPERQKEIASLGGKTAHAKGKAHKWTAEEAREAGRKGGIAAHQRPAVDGMVHSEDVAVSTEPQPSV